MATSNSSSSEKDTEEKTDNEITSQSFDSVEDFKPYFIEGNKFEFEVDISQKSIFEVEHKKSGKKYRDKVKVGWSAPLNEVIWEQFKSDCSWSFKRADVISKQVKVVGGCSFKTCNAKIEVQTSNNLNSMTIKIDDFDGNITHGGNKRRITGAQKVKVDKMLESSSAAKVHKKLVKEIMNPGDVEPAHLPTQNTLRVRKHRNQLKDFHKDPYQSLSLMSQYQLKKCIHYIGFNPFSVFYSTPLQRKWYRTQTTDGRRVVSIDATGLNIVPPNGSRISGKKTAKSSGQPKYQSIFLYVIMLRGIVSVPVGAMLSQDHTMRFISFWLSSWAFNNNIPDEIVLDQSAALFGACVQTFTNYKNTNAYVSACMDSLLHNTPVPPVYLRIDRYHFVCTLHRLKLFKKMDPMKVSLFKGIFGALILCDDLAVVKKTVIDLFTILRNRYMNEICEYSLIDLQKLCELHEINIGENEPEPDDYDDYDNDRGKSIFGQDEVENYTETSSYRLVK